LHSTHPFFLSIQTDRRAEGAFLGNCRNDLQARKAAGLLAD
jgi:hypothetical protein